MGISRTGNKNVRAKGRSLHIQENTNQPPGYDVGGYSCSMSSVDHGGRLTYDFDPDPVALLWGVNAPLNLIPTRGGQMVYSSSATLGPLSIVGYLRSRWDQLDLAEFVYKHMNEFKLKGKPLRFRYPERNIDFSIGIQSMDEVGLNSEEAEIVGYTLTCQITQDHTALKQAEESQLVPNLPINIEWIDVQNSSRLAESRFGPGFGVPQAEEKPAEETPVDDSEKKDKNGKPVDRTNSDPGQRTEEDKDKKDTGGPSFRFSPGI